MIITYDQQLNVQPIHLLNVEICLDLFETLDITSFNINSIKTDKRVLKEYERLQKIYDKNIRFRTFTSS